MIRPAPLLLLLAGCAADADPQLRLVAVDVSGSAADRQDYFYAEALAENDVLIHSGDRYELWAFDDNVRQTYVGKPFNTPEEFKPVFNAAMQVRQGRQGTDLARVVAKLDERLKASSLSRKRVVVLTDCGVDGVSPNRLQTARTTVDGWRKAGVEVEVRGVDAERQDDLALVFGAEAVTPFSG